MNDKSEAERLSALRGYGILDTPNEAEFDAIVQDAARLLGTPIALISLIDADRQWFKAKVGLEPAETPRSISFCTHAIRGPDMFVVEDASKDARFADNPLVTGGPGIRFYAGMPLKTPSGARVGTLCVIDNKPHRALTAAEGQHLGKLAERTMAAMAARQRERA